MEETRVCSKCHIEKEISNFRIGKYGHRRDCKECENARSRQYNKEHRTQINKRLRKRYKNDEKYRAKRLEINTLNKDKEYQKKYYEEHREYFRKHAKKYREQHLEEINEKHKLWKQRNQEHIKEQKRIHNQKRMEIPLERAKNRVRNMIRNSFERKGQRKSQSTEDIVGCTMAELIDHLIQTYEDNYNEKWKWEYLSEVHIDHIIPLYQAHNEEDVIRLCHYTNLQLLKQFDNLSKWKN